MRRLVTAVAIAGAVLVTGLGINPAASRAATSQSEFAAQPLSNPLLLRNPQTGAQVQIMPNAGWVAAHPPVQAPISTGSTTTSTAASTSSSVCTLGTDSSAGDATVLLNNSLTQYDSMDFTSFGVSSSASDVTGQVTVESLSNGTPVNGTPAPATPKVAGGGDVWYIVWNYGNTPGIKGYFLEAEYPGNARSSGFQLGPNTSNLPVSFNWGTIVTSPTGGDQFTSGGPADGTFDTSTNTITITAPLSQVGSPPSGAVLSNLHTEADALVGTTATGGLLEPADTLASTVSDYHVGQAPPDCPAPIPAVPGPGQPTQGSANNLGYYGGPIVHSIKNHIIWWLPKAGTTTYSDGSPCTIPGTTTYSYEQPASGTAVVGALPGGSAGDVGFKQIITKYFTDLGGTAFYNLLTQYADDQTGATGTSVSLAGVWTDNCGYTSTPSTTTGPIPGGTLAAPIYQLDIQAEVERARQVNHWPDGLGNEYFVFTGYNVADCFAPPGQGSLVPTCNVAVPTSAVLGGYCAYHGDYMDGTGNYVLYADMSDAGSAANPSSINLCYTKPIGQNDPPHTVTINGQPYSIKDPIADAEVNVTSHEEFETVNDAEIGTAIQLAPPLAWYDPINGEIGDKCAWNFGNYASDGSNLVLNGDHYIVQLEYSNWNNGCALTAYQRNGGYGGDLPQVTIQKGQNGIGIPVSGITDTAQLVASMEGPGQLPPGSITEVQVMRNGQYVNYFPGNSSSTPIPLNRTDGIIVTSLNAGTWTPSGPLYTSGPTIQLQQGWNLVAATWPNPGLMTDSIYNEIEAQNGACSAAVLTNSACSPTITDIKTLGAGGQYFQWIPQSADASGNATWPQTTGNQVPFTSAMMIYATKPLTWTVQGSQCQSVDDAGVCH